MTDQAARESLSHEERTAAEPRDKVLHEVILSGIRQVNSCTRLFKLSSPNGGPVVKFLPGQWLDVHVPGIQKAGGFTITSTPKDAEGLESLDGYVELAIQKSPDNPPAAWLWRPEQEILGAIIKIRVGGSFVWPPPGVNLAEIDRILLVAGGVGINPLMSILTHVTACATGVQDIRFLYSTKTAEKNGDLSSILFLPRLEKLASAMGLSRFKLDLYLTGSPSIKEKPGAEGLWNIHDRRIEHSDLTNALGSVSERSRVVCYVCGPSRMTDDFVDILKSAQGMEEKRVLCEKWW